MKVRPADVEDLDELARVHATSSEAAYGRPRDIERTREAWRVALESDASVFVVEADSGIVGVLSVGPAREAPGAGEVYVIYVLPEAWGSVAGQLLLERAHEVLAERYDDAVLTVLAGNLRARRFYERNGWELDELRTEPHFGGEPTEVARYRRRL
jgi:ribosomal protein S18 acetylase RimI-like enzyme